MVWHWYDIFFFAFAMWGVERIIDARIDKRLRAAGLPTPAKPKLKLPPGFWRGLVLNGLLFGGLFAFIFFARFAPSGPAYEHPLWGMPLVALFAVVAGLAIFWSRRDKRELAHAAATSAIAEASPNSSPKNGAVEAPDLLPRRLLRPSTAGAADSPAQNKGSGWPAGRHPIAGCLMFASPIP